MQNLAKTVVRELAEALQPESFRKKKSLFFHEGPDSILWIEVQKSRDSIDDRYIFTINLGAFLPILARTLGGDIRETDILRGHWRARLGLLLPVHDDYWWEVANTEQAAVIGREVAQGKRITRGKLGKIGKNVSRAHFSKIPRKQGIFESRPYNRLIVVANIVFGDISMSLEKSLEN